MAEVEVEVDGGFVVREEKTSFRGKARNTPCSRLMVLWLSGLLVACKVEVLEGRPSRNLAPLCDGVRVWEWALFAADCSAQRRSLRRGA